MDKLRYSGGREMTREQAEKEIRDTFTKTWADGIIKALEQEPITKNDLGVDAVSRQAVLNIAKASKSNWIDNSILFKRVTELPSATPQEPILDKIRAEIEQFANTHCSGDDINIYDVFQIIDKYKESEGKE